MIILENKPGMRVECKGCTSVYVVEQGDARALPWKEPNRIIRFLSYFDELEHGPLAAWRCPVCNYSEVVAIRTLPCSWLTLNGEDK